MNNLVGRVARSQCQWGFWLNPEWEGWCDLVPDVERLGKGTEHGIWFHTVWSLLGKRLQTDDETDVFTREAETQRYKQPGCRPGDMPWCRAGWVVFSPQLGPGCAAVQAAKGAVLPGHPQHQAGHLGGRHLVLTEGSGRSSGGEVPQSGFLGRARVEELESHEHL